ncbi:hypothetical protein B0T24DRAFT_394392 [Lasiosphaeria ovina]|uniref:Uncharacterized protein n=1 Tax=Lasiosphaeria ovina TaxID=92902 RepID=A0AAE0JX41_9PEZI|nr:hypothetical protein B0T24DRAFT_394392 [Lasiosphaeria ovina]
MRIKDLCSERQQCLQQRERRRRCSHCSERMPVTAASIGPRFLYSPFIYFLLFLFLASPFPVHSVGARLAHHASRTPDSRLQTPDSRLLWQSSPACLPSPATHSCPESRPCIYWHMTQERKKSKPSRRNAGAGGKEPPGLGFLSIVPLLFLTLQFASFSCLLFFFFNNTTLKRETAREIWGVGKVSVSPWPSLSHLTYYYNTIPKYLSARDFPRSEWPRYLTARPKGFLPRNIIAIRIPILEPQGPIFSY